jgi:hypothetical protein
MLDLLALYSSRAVFARRGGAIDWRATRRRRRRRGRAQLGQLDIRVQMLLLCLLLIIDCQHRRYLFDGIHLSANAVYVSHGNLALFLRGADNISPNARPLTT